MNWLKRLFGNRPDFYIYTYPDERGRTRVKIVDAEDYKTLFVRSGFGFDTPAHAREFAERIASGTFAVVESSEITQE